MHMCLLKEFLQSIFLKEKIKIFSAVLWCVAGFPAMAQDQPDTAPASQPATSSGAAPVSDGQPESSDAASDEDAAFAGWLDAFRSEALGRGIRSETLDTAFADIKLLKRVITRDRNQPEVVQTYAAYLEKRVSPWRREKGAAMMQDHMDDLAAIGRDYNVQPRFIAAIWGVETNYGTIPLTISVFDAVATLAYDPRRAKRFRRELFAAVEILDKGYAGIDLMKGSWAGAMGQPQFMPENYLKFAVDRDGDGMRDIWSNRLDVFASIANYLRHYGWRNDLTWGRPVMLPAPGAADTADGRSGEEALSAPQADGVRPAGHCRAYKSLGAWRSLGDWQAMGLRRVDGSDLPTRDIPAALVLGDANDGRGWLVYDNFCSIMRYNPSFKYALSVGLLSDAIRP